MYVEILVEYAKCVSVQKATAVSLQAIYVYILTLYNAAAGRSRFLKSSDVQRVYTYHNCNYRNGCSLT